MNEKKEEHFVPPELVSAMVGKCLATRSGLDPEMRESESIVLPITPPGSNIIHNLI